MTSPVQADVEQIRTAAERAARLTHQLLIFGRREKVQLEVLDLNAVVADVQSLLARSIGEQSSWSCTRRPTCLAVRADRGQLEQVLVNLAVNARDAMPDGGTLTIGPGVTLLDEHYARPASRGSRPASYVELSVSDTGVGMSPGRGRRGSSSRSSPPNRKDKGTGLGLATVHGIVAEAGGSLSVYSEPGIGTTFRAFFPAAEQARPPPAATPPAAGVPRAAARRSWWSKMNRPCCRSRPASCDAMGIRCSRRPHGVRSAIAGGRS